MLGYCAFVLADAWIFQNREDRHFEQALHQRLEAKSPQSLPAAFVGGAIGRIEVPRLGISVFVIEGTSHTTLRRAVGHIAGTALPGNAGNVGISGHRDTYFRPLRNIRQGDIITLTTLLGEYRYRVVSTKIVDPSDVGVLDQSGDQILTLVTCYPFYFVGSAPNRFIVRAERTS
jgi:sortase A